MMRHLQGPELDVSETYRQSQPIAPDKVVYLDANAWVTHYQGVGALVKRRSSGTHWAVRQQDWPPRRKR